MDAQNELIARLVGFLLLRKYEPGERVPSERELAERFKVGRGNIREALSYLEALRVIERKAKSGIFMAEGAASIEALAFFAQLGIPLNATEVQHSVEMRRIHEIAAVQLACERAQPGNLETLREVLKRSEAKIAKREPIHEEDRDFHLEIVNSTQNGVFHRIVQIFYLMTAERRKLYFKNLQRCKASHAEHLKIYAAIAKGNRVSAVNLVSAHLQGVDSYWQGLIDSDSSLPRQQRKEGVSLAVTAAR
jgi:DNA-binding FadR family transcriptional regulator